jgi:hypothetical protein
MRTRALDNLVTWIDHTAMSQTIQATPWIVPAVQTVHILAIAAVMSSILMINLRLLGVVGRGLPPGRFSAQFLPVIWWALPVLLLTGAVMVIGEPLRSLANAIFQLKMLLLIAAIAMTLGYQLPVRKNPLFWEVTPGRRSAARALVVVSLAVWIAIVCAGRWIAYVS